MILESIVKFFNISKNAIIKCGKWIFDSIKSIGLAKIVKNTIEIAGTIISSLSLFKKIKGISKASKYKAKHSMDVGLEIGAKKDKTEFQKNVVKNVAKTAFEKESMDSVKYENELKKLNERIIKAQTDKFESLCSDGLTSYDLNSNWAKFLRNNKIPENKIKEILLKDKLAIKERKKQDVKTEEDIMDRHFFGDDVFDDDYEGIEPETDPILLKAANKYYSGKKLNNFEKFCFNEYLNNYGKKFYNEERRGMSMRAASEF